MPNECGNGDKNLGLWCPSACMIAQKISLVVVSGLMSVTSGSNSGYRPISFVRPPQQTLEKANFKKHALSLAPSVAF